jgi:excinuclease ABC subunit A
VTLRGLNVGEVLRLTIEEAGVRFAREAPWQERLEAARASGLGHHLLGQSCARLERGEWVRLQLAVAQTRLRRGDLMALDNPSGEGHPQDVELLLQALDRLLERGASVLVADHHVQVVEAADWLVEMGPGAGPQGGKIIACGPPASLAQAG